MKNVRHFTIIISLVVLSLSLPMGIARAEGIFQSLSLDERFPGEWGVGVGVFGRTSPYKGDDESLIPLPIIYYKGARLQIQGPQVDFQLYSWEQGPVKGDIAARVAYQFEGYDASDSSFLTGMKDRDGTLYAGLKLGLKTKYIDADSSVLFDVLSEHDGYKAELTLKKLLPISRWWAIEPSAGVVWKSDDMADYYYGVLPGESRIGRPAYAPGSVLNYRLGLNNIFPMGEHWTLIAGVRAEFLDDDATDSAIVDDDVEYSGFAGVLYRF